MSFFDKIKKFNDIYKLPNHDTPIDASENFDMLSRLSDFHSIISEEVEEGQQLIEKAEGNELGCSYFQDENGNEIGQRPGEIEFLTDMSDWLGDMIVYCASEARRWGIPIEQVLDIIMESNFSKLGGDGKPLYDDRGKVLKGPNYWKPEPKIKELLLKLDSERKKK